MKHKMDYKISSQDKLFRIIKQYDYEGQNITGVTFEILPFVSENFHAQRNQTTFDGFEPKIISTLTEILNLNLLLRKPLNGTEWMAQSEDVLGKNCGIDYICQETGDLGFANIPDM